MDYNYKIYTDDVEIPIQHTEVKICFVISGKVSLIQDADILEYEKGDLFILKPYDPFMILKVKGILTELNINSLTFNRFALHNTKRLENEMKIGIGHHKLLNDQFLETMLQINKRNWFDADISIIRLINYVRMYNYYNPDDLKVTSPIIKNVLNYIDENYHKDLKLNTLASHFYVNPSYLSRLFSSEMNISFVSYIKKVKIYKTAIKILSENSIKSVWRYSGYKSYSTFLENFKSVFNVSPEEFLKRGKNSNRERFILPDISYELEEFYKNIEERYGGKSK
ncbi:AraC family transcriptional regulator [Staphylococcus xylosus]|uniref:AraC family transcriptional regulator n=1 Tax=Staphylococcus xylosus TaxID=1288 RepID=UPI000E69F666|nr:AraC family transcriptional regulator [Staphylococcus xylosus]RIM82155.1 AraC family transcriptional regulator [Staphylococcus xylosus]